MDSITEKQVRHYVKRLRYFYISLVRYLCVSAALIAINLAFSPMSLWFVWVSIPWGISLLFRGMKLFIERRWGEEWQERKVAHYMSRDEIHREEK